MAFRLPRISIVTSDEQGAANMGELNMLSLGLGLHLAWMQAAFFDSTMPEEGPNGSFPFLFVVAMASFLATLLFAALTDQKPAPLHGKTGHLPCGRVCSLGLGPARLERIRPCRDAGHRPAVKRDAWHRRGSDHVVLGYSVLAP